MRVVCCAIPPALDQIVRHCLEKNPAERFLSYDEFVMTLTEKGDA